MMNAWKYSDMICAQVLQQKTMELFWNDMSPKVSVYCEGMYQSIP